jgi:hypothetical protein
MGTNYIAPIWRMPRNANKDKLSNYSIDFNGSTDYIEISDNILSGLANFSISVWYNARTLPTDGSPFEDKAILGAWTSGVTQMLLYWDDPNGWRFLMSDGTVSTDVVWGTATTTNEWHHIVVTFDGSTLRFYHDNTTPVTDGGTGPVNTSASAWRIGADTTSPTTTRHWDGKLSQFCLFDYALSTNQINYLYNLNNPMVPGAVNLTAPVAYYPLGDNSNPNAPGSFPNISVGADSVFDFNGTQAIDTPLIDLGVDASLSMWFNPDPAGPGDYVLIGYSAAGFDYTIRKQSGTIVVWIGPTFYQFTGFGSNVVNGSWNFLALTKNRGEVILYLKNSDGDFSASRTEISWQTADLRFDRIGARSITPINLAFQGEISNVQAWDVTLSSPDVDSIYNNGQPLMTGTQPQESNLQAWYKLNQSANYDQGIGPWDIEIVGTPDYAGTTDGCYTTGTALRYADTGDQVTGSGNYFRWLTPLISCQGTIDITHTLGGEYVTASSGVQLTFQYSLDGGGWVTYHNELVSSSASTTPVTFTITSATGLSCNNNIKVRVLGAGGLFNASYIEFYNIKIADGAKTFYEQDFSNYSSLIGYNNGNVFNQSQVGNYIDPVWQIPDNRSAYPQSFDFDGNNDFIDLGTTTDYDTGDLSVSVWVKASSSRTTTAYIVSNSGSTSYAGFDIAIRTNDQIRLRRNTRTQINDPGWRTVGFVDDVWQHLAFTYNESSNTLKLFLNGELKNTTTGTSQSVGASRLLTIGSYIGAQSFLLGQISNPQIWNTTLSDTQVETLYNNGVPLTTAIATDNLKAWYKLDNTDNWNSTVNNWSIYNNKYPIPTPTYTEGIFFGGSYIGGSPSVNYAGMRLTNQSISSSNITYSFWYKRVLPNSGSSAGIVKAASYVGGVNIGSGGTVQWSGDAAARYINFSGNVADGAWHHILIYYPNGSTIDHTQVKCYIDGTLRTNTYIGGSSSVGPLTTIQGTLQQSVPLQVELSNWAIFTTDETSNIDTIYNGGTPGDISSLNPFVWLKYDSATTAFDGATGANYGLATDSSGNSNNGNLAGKTDGTTTKLVTSNVIARQAGTSSGMTEQNLVFNNVSSLNGESSGMNSTNLVTSNISRTQPYSNYSFNFDRGQADFFDLGTDSSMDVFSSDFSCSVWFNHTDASGGANAILEFSTFAQKFGMQLGFTSNTGVSFSFGPNPSQTWYYNGGSGYNDGNWHNFIVTYNGSSLKGYVDGVELTFSTGSITLGGFNAIGKGRNTPTYFNGKLSNCCLFDRDLTEQEILKIYNNGVTQDLQATSSFSNNIAAWWPMDEHSSYYDGTDWVIRDLENGNDGDGNNTGNVDDLVGNAPGSDANGSGNNLAIEDLIGDMKDSKLNAFSINMADYADGVTNPANSGRSTDTP